MGTIAQHRAGIKANLDTQWPTEVDVLTHETKTTPSGNWFVVSFPDSYARPDIGTARTIVYPVRFEIPWDDDESSDAALETFMGAAMDAIESDPTLGGSCHSAACLNITDIGASRKLDDKVVLQFVVPVEVFD